MTPQYDISRLHRGLGLGLAESKRLFRRTMAGLLSLGSLVREQASR